MTLGVDITHEAREAFDRLRKSRVTNYAIVLVPDVDTLKLNLETEYNEGITLDDLALKLPQDQPRFVVYMPERVHPDGRKSYPLILISYCPPSLPPQVNIVYSNSRSELHKTFQVNHMWDINRRLDLDDEDLKEKFNTNKWD